MENRLVAAKGGGGEGWTGTLRLTDVSDYIEDE